MFADGLIRAITFDIFDACAPCENASIRREHINSVIFDTLDEEPETFFAPTQSRFGFAAFGPFLRLRQSAMDGRSQIGEVML